MANDNPQRDLVCTDEPCPIRLPFSFDDDDDSPRSLGWVGDGQALTGLRFIITEAFDVGSITIGKTGSVAAYMPAVNLVGLAVGTVVEVTGLLIEMTADTEVLLTCTGNPTTGALDGFLETLDKFDSAK